MSKVSIIIPSCNEVQTDANGVNLLQRTVQDVYDKATGEFEVIVGFNGKPYQEFPSHDNLIVFNSPENIGLKPMINKLASMATGKYIYKSDAHCSFGKSFDEILQADMEENWVVTPRFYVLDPKTFKVQDERFYDYFYLCCPFTDKRGIRFKAGGHWMEKTQEKLDVLIDETPQMHGSGWFVNRDYFLNDLGGFPEEDPLGHAQEPIWLGLRNWLRGGKLMVNKKTWYAHTHQDGNKRGYPEDKEHTEKTYKWTADYFLTNTDEKRIHDFEWFVDKFMPMPSWPDNWKELYAKYKEEHA